MIAKIEIPTQETDITVVTHLDFHFSRRQGAAYARIRAALMESNARHSEDKPMSYACDAMRWILDQVADAIETGTTDAGEETKGDPDAGEEDPPITNPSPLAKPSGTGRGKHESRASRRGSADGVEPQQRPLIS